MISKFQIKNFLSVFDTAARRSIAAYWSATDAAPGAHRAFYTAFDIGAARCSHRSFNGPTVDAAACCGITSHITTASDAAFNCQVEDCAVCNIHGDVHGDVRQDDGAVFNVTLDNIPISFYSLEIVILSPLTKTEPPTISPSDVWLLNAFEKFLKKSIMFLKMRNSFSL
jgi:hypothetical protein